MATIKKLATDLNWEATKKSIYGVHEGFSVSLVQNISFSNQADNYKALFIPVENLTQEAAGHIGNYIVANKKQLRVITYHIDIDLVSIRLNEAFKGINSVVFQEILSLLIAGFRQAGISPRTTCIYCNQEEPDTITYVNNIKLPAHSTCKQEALQKHQQLKQEIEGQKNGPGGYIGAIIGAIIGVIPYIIAVWFGWFVGLLTFLTGFTAYKGFKIGGGHTQKSTKWIVSVIALIIILLSNFAIIEFLALGYGVTFAEVLAVEELAAIFYEMLGMSFLFGLLGISGIFVKIKKDEFNTVIE